MTAQSTDTQIIHIAEWLQSGSINIFGRPFAGKDTQGQRLAELLHAPIIGGGDILRNQADTPEHVRNIIDMGQLAPTEEYLKIVTPYLSQPMFAERPLILSSVGRWHGEEEGILRAAHDSGHPLMAAVYLDLSEANVHKRWLAAQEKADREQRADDAAENIDTRLKEFRAKTLPVIEFYRDKKLLIEIDGDASPGAITRAILQALDKIVQSN